MSDLSIDTMSEKDIDPVLLIEHASFQRPWSRLAFLNELSNKYSHNFILKLENSSETYQIIGYLCFRFIIDEIHILKIAVHPDQRCKGTASKFLSNCIGELCGQRATSAILDVRQSNTAGIGLYKKNCFAIEAQIPNYYPDTREDLILMRKNFLKEV
jgi:ribosomal-protein-alanine N-acetyltransferase